MWIRYIGFFALLFIAVMFKLCSYRKGEFSFQNDRSGWLKRVFLRAKGGFEEMKHREDFSFDIVLLVMIILVGLLLLK